MDKRNVKELLIATGSLLVSEEHPQKVSGEIRGLQEKLRNVEDESIQCLVFMLNLIIDDVFFNISGDNGYNNIMYDTRDIIFKQIGKTFVEIGNAVEISDSVCIHNSFCELTNVYIRELKNINLEFDRGRLYVTT